MANNDILSEFSSGDVSHFKKDFIQMIKVGAEIDRYYAEAQHDLDVFIPKFEILTEKFNKKYKGLKIKTRKAVDSYKVRIFVRERDIKEFFAKTASRIPGLKSIGRTGFNQIDISDAEKFARFLDSPLSRLYISYSDPETGTSTIAAFADSKEKMIELIYNPVEIANENSAGFRICAFYALSSGLDKKIEIYGDASTFGFYNLLDEFEKREWYDKFNPRWLE
ncbi:hypothetical protein HYX07_03375 [Candidatus Woesearchaeota archaeon]|nr:hypothetical protein [Candidatus Woesearchaeota archaeon]